MTQTYVSARLVRCAIWTRSGAYPGPKPVISWWGPMVLRGNVQQPGNPDKLPQVDWSEAAETYTCVLTLPLRLRKAIFECYFKPGTIEQKCRALRCSKQTYYNRIERAQNELLGLFNDVAAGIEPPSARVRKWLTASMVIVKI